MNPPSGRSSPAGTAPAAARAAPDSAAGGPPRIAELLGALALLPFLTGAVLVALPGLGLRAIAGPALSAYAATVVAFIGALHWGLAFPLAGPRTASFVWGVMPAIVAWIALTLADPAIGLPIHAAMLVLCYLVDRRTYPGLNAARWLPLRLRLTVPATVCCLAGAWFGHGP